jgi:hypothetical protein
LHGGKNPTERIDLTVRTGTTNADSGRDVIMRPARRTFAACWIGHATATSGVHRWCPEVTEFTDAVRFFQFR